MFIAVIRFHYLLKGYVLDCPLAITAALTAHLKTYKLRSKVKIKDVTHLYDVLVSGIRDPWKTVAEEAQKGSGGNVLSHSGVSAKQAAPGLMNTEYSARFEDPRCAALGTRLLRLKGNGGGELELRRTISHLATLYIFAHSRPFFCSIFKA